VAIGDLNGDTNPDLAIANASSDDVTVLLGDGSGGFIEAADSPFPVGNTPTSVAIGDLNGDTNPDLATANFGSDDVTVLLGDGSGGFTEAAGSPFPTGPGPATVAIGDLNGDTNPDLAVTNSFASSVTVLLGDGNGGFTEAAGSPFPTDEFPVGLAIGDLDGDTDLDLVTANNNTSGTDVTVLLNDGSGGFTPAPGSPFSAGSGPLAVAIGDLDGDTNPDLAIANYFSDDVTVLLGDGSGGFTEATGSPFSAGVNPLSVAIGDLDGDTNPDLVTANQSSGDVTVLLGDGSGGFTEATESPFSAGQTPRAVAIGDLDNDTDLDLAIANSGSDDVTVLLNQRIAPEGPPGSASCSDFVDNDNDNLTDQADPDCQEPEGPFGDSTCGDGVDNDGDGQTDAADQDCAPPPDADGDGVPDATDNCVNAANPGQQDADSDGVGNACDTEGPFGNASCGDTFDNDGDGQTDGADSGCAPPPPSNDLCFGMPATITGNGTVTGTNGDDVIITGNGNDTVDGRGGNDRICTRGGDDFVRGGTGNDSINSGNGNDNTGGQDGNDLIQSTGGNDDVQGGAGNDRVQGGDGNDTLNGGDGADRVEGEAGSDLLAGNAGAPDTCDGGSGTDATTANGGCEVITNIP
jgi:hypothetical protein